MAAEAAYCGDCVTDMHRRQLSSRCFGNTSRSLLPSTLKKASHAPWKWTLLYAYFGRDWVLRMPVEKFHRDDGTSYDSGTEFEFEDAVQACRQRGVPDVLVYRKTAKPFADLTNPDKAEEATRQKRALDLFIDRWFAGQEGTVVASLHPFDRSRSFEDLLETHLEKLIENRMGPHVAARASVERRLAVPRT